MQRKALYDKIKDMVVSIVNENNNKFDQILLYGSDTSDVNK